LNGFIRAANPVALILALETGVLYAIIAGVLWGTSPVLVKRGLVHSDVSSATLIQQAVILCTLIGLTLFEESLSTGPISVFATLVFIATGAVGAYLGRTLFVKSVDQIGASRAQSVNNTSPLVTVLLAALLLGERLTVTVLVGVVLIVSGIFFIPKAESQLDGRPATRILTFTSVLATLCYGLVPVMKKFGTDSGGSPMLGALVMHATGLLLLLAFGRLLKIELKWKSIALSSLVCFVGAGVLQAFGSIYTLKALLYAPTSVVAPIWSTQPIISFFLARVTLKGIEVVTIRDGIAAALVVIGVVVLRWA
jgi:drug/metabolite transporter (DMT)-like permease